MKLKLDYVDGKTEWIDNIRGVVINAPHISNGFGFKIAGTGEWVWSAEIMYATLDGERVYPTENEEVSELEKIDNTDYSRENLISIIEKAFVNEDRWNDRDSAAAQKQLGECYALLKCGCDFYILTDGDLKTDKETIWVRILSKGFSYYEYNAGTDADTYFIPTESRLEKANGSDWY